MRDSRAPLLALALLVVVAIGAGLVREQLRKGGASRADSATAAAPGFPDEDLDGAPDPVPIRRLAATPAGAVVLDALATMGGWSAYARHAALRFRAEGAFFDARGVLVGTRSEVGLVTLQGPPRLRVETDDGTEQFGLGDAGPWGGLRAANGLWNPTLGPGALSRAELARLAWENVWFARLPFGLGDVDVTLEAREAAPGDSLERLVVRYPPAPSDTIARRYELGFDPESALLCEVRYAAPGDSAVPRVVVFDDWRELDGLLVPHRRRLYGTGPDGAPFLEFDLLFTVLAPVDSLTPESFRAPAE